MKRKGREDRRSIDSQHSIRSSREEKKRGNIREKTGKSRTAKQGKSKEKRDKHGKERRKN